LSVGSVALQDYPDLRERLEKTLVEIDRLAGDRNAAIHTYWAGPAWWGKKTRQKEPTLVACARR
jgi:hypothetical protein